jgi:hypothetical protein
MAKQKKNNHSDIQPVPRESVAAVGEWMILFNCCDESLNGPFLSTSLKSLNADLP